MSNPRKPRGKTAINAEQLAKVARADRREVFLETLFNRSEILMAEMKADTIPKEVVALETLQSALSFFAAGHAHSDIVRAYPAISWREDTVTVPLAFVRVLVDGWAKFKMAGPGATIGECLHLEGGGQGSHNAREKLRHINKELRLSNASLVLYLEGEKSWDMTNGEIAAENAVGEDIVKRAIRKRSPKTLAGLAAMGVLKSGGS